MIRMNANINCCISYIAEHEMLQQRQLQQQKETASERLKRLLPSLQLLLLSM